MDRATLTQALIHAQAGQWAEAKAILKSLESGIEWSDDAPPSALLAQDGLLVSAGLACTEARVMPAGDAYWPKRAVLLIQELLGDDKAAETRATLEANEAQIAATEMGMDLDSGEPL